MGCIQSKAAGTKDEESKRLTRNTNTPRAANSEIDRPNFNRLSAHIPESGPLSQEDYWDRLDVSPAQAAQSGSVALQFAFVSQRGFYPDQNDKPNQDSVYVKSKFGGLPDTHFFGVFDGHGQHGDEIALFAKYKVPENLAEFPRWSMRPEEALRHTMTWTNEQLHQGNIQDEMSGTTAICCLFQGNTLWTANVGDSRAIAVLKENGVVTAEALSSDQTPFRADELARVRDAGALVLSLDQMEGHKSQDINTWTEEEDGGDPPRLWKSNQMYPGTAFTRSIGDRIAEEIGVSAEPEISRIHLGPKHHCIVIASDGVFEFITNEQVAEIVSENDDPQEAAIQMVAEAYRLWLQFETRTDDISAIVIYLRHPENESKRSAGRKMPKVLSIANTLNLKKKQPYTQMDEEDGLLRHKSGGSQASFSSRYFSDDEQTPRRALERQESRSKRGAVAESGSPKMSVPPPVLNMSQSFSDLNSGSPTSNGINGIEEDTRKLK